MQKRLIDMPAAEFLLAYPFTCLSHAEASLKGDARLTGRIEAAQRQTGVNRDTNRAFVETRYRVIEGPRREAPARVKTLPPVATGSVIVAASPAPAPAPVAPKPEKTPRAVKSAPEGKVSAKVVCREVFDALGEGRTKQAFVDGCGARGVFAGTAKARWTDLCREAGVSPK